MTKSSRRRAAWVAILGCGFAVACGTSNPSGPKSERSSENAEPGPASVITPDRFGELLGSPLPLDGLVDSGGPGPSPVEQARQLLLERCMSAKGLTYITEAVSSGPPREERFGEYLGVTNVMTAMQTGYHPSGAAKSEIERRLGQAAAEANSRPSPEYLDALTGSPDEASSTAGGCILQTSEQLGAGQGVDPTNVIGRLTEEATTAVLQSAAYESALAAWSRCMKQHGIDPPASPFDFIPKYGEAADPTSDEIKVATIDVDCKSSSGLVSAFMAEQRDAQARLADLNAAAIAEVRRVEQEMIDRAQRVLAGG